MNECDKKSISMKKPEIIKYGSDKWIIYKDSIPPPLKHPKACLDTIHAICEDKNLEECIKICNDSDKCSFGYHLKDGKKNICLPIYTSDYYPDSNPTYSLKNQECYNLEDSVKTHTFLNNKHWGINGILPNEANAVFYDDIVLIGHNEKNNNSFLKSSEKGKITFEEFGGTKLKLLSKFGKGLISRIEYGDHLSFNIVKNNDMFSSEVMIVEPKHLSKTYPFEEKVIFKSYKNIFVSEEQKFTIIPVYDNNNSDTFNYNSNFYLRSMEGFLEIKRINNIVKLFVNTTHDPTKSKNHNNSMIFTLIPTKKIYTCKNGICSEYLLKDIKQKKGHEVIIDGNVAYTRNDCFGSCYWSSDKLSTTNKNINKNCGINKNNLCIVLIIILTVLIFLSIVVLK